jgi:hypothetical protein
VTDLREYLIALRSKNGVLTPRLIVEDARPETSPIHNHFEWDNAVAAEAYRLEQARDLVRSVRVSYTAPSGREEKTRAFVNLQREGAPSRDYTPVEEVAADPVLQALALREAERAWRELYERYKHLDEFLKLVASDVQGAA